MTGLGDERNHCAMRPLPSSGKPAGAATSLPPHIQGAERRSERRARATGSRWGLRVLVVGGLAGAAWLLTGAAAHAADRTDGPVGSLLGSVVDGDVTTPVSGLLDAAARPLEAATPVTHLRTAVHRTQQHRTQQHGTRKHSNQKHSDQKHVVADILEVPQRVLTRPALKSVATDPLGTTVDPAKAGVDKVLREVVEPTRLTGEPAADPNRLTAVTDHVTPDADQVAELPQEPAVAPEPAVAVPAPAVTASHARIVQALPAPAAAVQHGVPARYSKAASASIGHRHPVMHRAVAGPAAATEDQPGGDGPAPLQVHLGDVSGTPTTSWSGSPADGGSAAFLPAAIASSTMACQRLPIASEVEVRRIDAEAPTVSPD